MEYKFDFKDLEEKYDFKINYPGMYRRSIKTFLMQKSFDIYITLRKSVTYIFPFVFKEEKYNSYRIKHPIKRGSNSPENVETSFYNNEFIHMYDFIPKENMVRLVKEINQLTKKHVNGRGGIGGEGEKTLSLKSFVPSGFQMPTYSLGIKEQSPLYSYISEIYIGFQELTTSINTVLYSVVLNKSLIEKLNNICIDDIDDFFVLEPLNLKWYEFYKMGYSTYSGNLYKKEFINACIRSIKWNVICLLKRYITFYLIKDKEVLPSVNVYHTNIDGNRNAQFWESIQIERPEFCDFMKDGTACINWSKSIGNVDYIYKSTYKHESYELIYPMDIRYFYSQFLVRGTIIQQTYSRIEKCMEICDKYNMHHIKLKKWLAYKAEIERQNIYYKRFYNESKKEMYDASDFKEMFIIHTGDERSITEQLIEEQYQKAEEASTALKQMLDYIDTNIEYRSSIENYKIQSRTLVFTFISMAVATLALVVTCMTNDNISNFVTNHIEMMLEWIYSLVCK